MYILISGVNYGTVIMYLCIHISHIDYGIVIVQCM